MKFYTSIPERLKPYYKTELEKYRAEYSKGNLKSAWNHLERAHNWTKISLRSYFCALENVAIWD